MAALPGDEEQAAAVGEDRNNGNKNAAQRQAGIKVTDAAGDFLGRAVMGGAAAGVSKVVAAPIERVKLLLQSQGEMISQGRLDRPYNGIGDCFRRVYANEGLWSFWRGTSANVLRIAPTQALNFSFKPLYNRIFSVAPDASYPAQLGSKVASGGAAGATSALVVYPLDMARTRLANDAKPTAAGGVRQFNGLWDVFRKIYRVDGLPGLYRGLVPSLIGAIAYRGAEFGLYDFLKPIWLQGPLQTSFAASFALGYLCTVTAGLVVYPFDTVRRTMMQTSGEKVRRYKGLVDVFLHIVRTGGARALYNGSGANILRGIAGAGALSGYDAIQRVAVQAKDKISDATSS
ncbi:unnamed protein product [Tilletia controversa]|uniref:ADP/ATP translocase n=3 Tax=Tilletia TaxID=13289 RepID=A0A8X7SYD1_9BASI|nr:hypothetical protein CF336_g5381 [Tilletia laevis]KAE8196086.1 hypothetical protein CF328_g4244 [Tilletia controversa]KAE8257542.1 hypothetical protein A4X03_0g4635 [Tilletia caries]KAE8197426.1 hypothetical protein CF335_g4619 [Tilletia laevis]KAE8251029.1 hypothetical protein A4X06_0g2845 [Tilletia controversa]